MWLEVLPLALLGGLLGLDVVSFPQAMISRPLVAATLAGALLGHPVSGILMGATLELIALDTLPFGASRYPEWGSAAVVGGALFAAHPAHPAGSMAMAVIAAIATSWIGGWTMVKLREANAHWAAHRRAALDAGSRGAVIELQLLGMTADFVRGAVLTVVAYVVFAPISEAALALWKTDARLSRAVVVAVAASVAASGVWKIFHAVPLARWFFVGGLVIGLALLAAS
jgi:mannose/fructose/N-acetylgalactosamine-specific phosphotransferase system component IIC